MTLYRYVGPHAREFTTDDTRPQVGPGEYVELTDTQAQDPANLSEEGSEFLVDATGFTPEMVVNQTKTTKAAPTS